jgi:hypothetical protein
VKACIKLAFKNKAGTDMVCNRLFRLTQKRAKLEFKVCVCVCVCVAGWMGGGRGVFEGVGAEGRAGGQCPLRTQLRPHPTWQRVRARSRGRGGWGQRGGGALPLRLR